MEYNQNTTDLLNFLKTIHTQEELDSYLRNHTSSEMDFAEYYNYYLEQHSFKASEAIERSGLEKHYAYQILNGTKSNPGCLKVIALCIGAHMNLKDTQRCLKLTKNASLYPKDTRDAIIITHINLEQWNIMKINSELWEHGLEPVE